MKLLSEKLKNLRKEKGWTLDKLAIEAGVSKSYIWEVENKPLPRPSAIFVKKMAEALNVDIAYLVDETGYGLKQNAHDRRFYMNYLALDTETKNQVRRLMKSFLAEVQSATSRAMIESKSSCKPI